MNVVELQLSALIYEKLHSLPILTLKYFDTGIISNLVTGDMEIIKFAFRFSLTIITVPFFLTFSTVSLYFHFSWAALFVPLVVIIIVLLQFYGSKFLKKFSRSRAKHADKRGKLVSEVFNGIKNIKFNCWEDLVKEKTDFIRKKEVHDVFSFNFWSNVFRGLAHTTPVLVNVVVITVYNSYIGEFDLKGSLALIAYGNMLMLPTLRSIIAISRFVNADVSFKRIDDLLKMKSKENFIENSGVKGEILLRDLSLGWIVK